MFTQRFVKMVGVRMLVIATALAAVYIFIVFAVSTDRLWLLATLPLACTIPPSLHNIHWRELMIDEGRVKGSSLAVGNFIPRLVVMNCVVFGLAIAIPSLVLTTAATVCYFSAGVACIGLI